MILKIVLAKVYGQANKHADDALVANISNRYFFKFNLNHSILK